MQLAGAPQCKPRHVKSRPRLAKILVAGLVLCSSLPLARPADAQVLEVTADGAVIRHEGAETFTRELVAPITPEGVQAALDGASDNPLVRSIESAAAAFGLDGRLLEAVAWQESRLRPDARSPRGAFGLMQLSAAAAQDVGVDRRIVQENILGGAAYLRRMLDEFGDTRLALAAYNAGPNAVRRYRGLPPFPETRAYVAAVLNRTARHPVKQEDENR